MNQQLINAFIEPLQSVLSTMAAVEATAGEPAIKHDPTACGEVSGVMELAGTRASLSFALTFSTPAILGIMERVMGERGEDIDDEVKDMVCEFTNMVTGGAKNLLGEIGYEFEMSIPTVVAGRGHEVQHPSCDEIVTVPVSTECGELCIELGLDQSA